MLNRVLLDGKQSWVGAALGKFRDQLNYFTTMTQKAYQNPDIGGLQRFKLAMDWMHSINSKVAAEATRVAEAWTKMGKERRAVMERVIKEEYKNGEHWTDMQEVNGTLRHVAGERLAKELADRHISLDDGQLQLYLDQKNQYLSRLNMQQAMQRTMINKRYAGRPGLIRSRTQALEQVYQSVRERPFMSQTRFGEHGFVVRSEDGRVNYMQNFETKWERDREAAKMQERINQETGNTDKVHPYVADRSVAFLRTVDPKLVSTFAQEFELTPKQKKALALQTDLAYRNAHLRRYSSHMSEIDGADASDMAVNFAHFMLHDGKNMVKMAAREEFMGSIRDVSEQIHYADLQGDFKEHARLTGVRDFMQKYQSHIMYGAKDFQAARSFVVMKMLWGNFRSALANLNALYQIWTDHSSRFGLVQGTKTSVGAAGRGLSNAASVAFQKTMGLVSRGPVEGWESYNPNQRWALNEAMKSGIIDETFAWRWPAGFT